MRHFLVSHGAGRLVLFVFVGAALVLIGAGQASAATLNVCPSGCPYTQLAPALAAAKDGDTIKIAPGTYAGGVTIDVSVKLVGAGAARTVISGGGPVLTIGTFGASSEPTVSIDGVTITGGVTRSSPESVPFTGQEGVFAAGGGVEIPPNADFSGGAAVTIRNSVITDNRVAPTDTAPFGPPCPSGPCPFAFAGGGGIDSWGTLTLENTTVSNNRVGTASGLSTLASDAVGGAIASRLGPLRIDGSVVHGNQASATGPNARFAEGGGVYAPGGSLRMTNSAVTDNSALLEASLPDTVELLAQSGGIFIGSGSATIADTRIAGNSVAMTNSVGSATAFSGGLNVLPGGDFRMSNSVIADNEVSSAAIGSQGDAEGDTGGGALLGTVTNTRITGNTVTISSAGGDAFAAIGGLLQFGSLTNSVVSNNHLQATSPQGSASVAGAGVMVAEQTLTLKNTEVSRNTGAATGSHGFGRGGGIYDGPTPFEGLQGSPLVLVNSTVTGNSLSGSSGITLQGGGLFIQNQPLTLTHSVIAGNSPDQCFGC
jgi:hypothetical protein